MNKTDLRDFIKMLSQGFLQKKIDGRLFAKFAEGLIAVNEDIADDSLNDFADFLAQYDPDGSEPELYNNKELIQKIKQVFKLNVINKKPK